MGFTHGGSKGTEIGAQRPAKNPSSISIVLKKLIEISVKRSYSSIYIGFDKYIWLHEV